MSIDFVCFFSLGCLFFVLKKKTPQKNHKYLKMSAPSWSPMDKKSLLGLIGLSPRHSSRPSLAVLLKRIKRLVLDPDTLKKNGTWWIFISVEADINKHPWNIIHVTGNATFSGYLCYHRSGSFGQWTAGSQWLPSRLGRENMVFTWYHHKVAASSYIHSDYERATNEEKCVWGKNYFDWEK